MQGNGEVNPNYNFHLATPEFTTQSLTFGETIVGNISRRGERDSYTFEGVAGQQLFFDSLKGNINLKAKLFSPTGAILFNQDTNLDRSPFILGETGIYRLEIDANWAATGDYSFKLGNSAQAKAIDLGNPIASSLSPGNEIDLYRLNGTIGQRLFFDLVSPSWSGANWVLYGPDNRILANPTNTAPDFRLSLPASGIYTLAINGTGSSSTTTNYNFTVSDETPNTVTLSGLQVIEGEAAGTYSGTIVSGQVVEGTFTAPAGTRVYLDSRDTDDNNLNIILLNPDGSNVTTNSASNDVGPFLLTQSGTYRVKIQGVAATSTGDYNFALMYLQTAEPNSLADIRRLTLDAEITKPLENGRTTHILTFEGKAGQRLFSRGVWGAIRPPP
jgi:hypothetical protein